MSYFYDYIKKFEGKTVNVYIDMDGVVADYDFEGYLNEESNTEIYFNKRPVYSSIKPLEEISKLNNVNLYIMSVARYNSQVTGKVRWLDKYMKFIKKDNIFILPRDKNGFKKAYVLKRDFIKTRIKNDDINIHIDDSHEVLKVLRDLKMNIKLLHVTEIID